MEACAGNLRNSYRDRCVATYFGMLEPGIGNGEWGMGNGECGMGNEEQSDKRDMDSRIGCDWKV